VAFGLLDYLSRLLARRSVSPLMLFPQYRDVLQVAEADRVHPADLWQADFQWRELPQEASLKPRNADDEARGVIEAQVLALMRDPGRPAGRMSDLCAELAAGARARAQPQEATLWQLAAAVFEAQAGGLLAADVYSKRMASRLLAQLRASARGGGAMAPSDRLAQDLLFFCARAREPEAGRAPRLAAVRHAWRLGSGEAAVALDYEQPRLGRFDPALIAQARKRVAALKDAWSAVAAGELHRLQPLVDQIHLVGESLQKLFPGGQALARTLEATAAQVVTAAAPPTPALAMEVATATLFLDASLEDGELDQPELAERMVHLAGRIDALRNGAEPRPLEVWMETLYRRVSDRQTMGSVVSELRSSLSEVEKHVDQYFRNPAERAVLIPVPEQLRAMRGVLSVLGMDHAAQATLHMRDMIDQLAQTDVDAELAIGAGTFDRLAENLGALSFLIDMLSVQPELARSLFRFDAASGSLTALMGRTERAPAFGLSGEQGLPMPVGADTVAVPLSDQVQALARTAAEPDVADGELAREAGRLAQAATAADQLELAQRLGAAHRGLDDGNDADARAQARDQLAEIAGLSTPQWSEPPPPPAPVPPPRPAPVGGTGLEDDAEMREIFVEEAREVVAEARDAVERLALAPSNLPDMTTVRRAFHTLKGSSRMIGLKDFGEASWSCEQLFNARLAADARMDEPLREFSAEALVYLGDWVEAIAAGTPRGHESDAVARAADALRLEGRQVPVGPLPAAADSEPQIEEPIEESIEEPAYEAAVVMVEGGEVAERPEAAELSSEQLPEPASEPEGVEIVPPPVLDERSAEEAVVDGFEDGALLAEMSLDIDLGELTLPDFNLVDEAQERANLLPSAGPAASDGPTIVLPISNREAPPPPVVEAPRAGLGSVSMGDDPDEGGPPSAGAELQLLFDIPEPAAPEPPPLLERLPFLPYAGDLDFRLEADVPAEPLPETAEEEPADLSLHAPEPAVEVTVPLSPGEDVAALEMDLADLDGLALPEADARGKAEAQAESEPAPASDLETEREPEVVADDDEQVKRIGELRIPIPLFNIYLNEADELSRRLVNELADWSLEAPSQPVSDTAVALAHSLAGSSATVGYAELSALARALEHALMRSAAAGRGRPGEPELFSTAAEQIRHLLHQFAAGFLRPVAPALMEALADHERLPPTSEDAAAGLAPETEPAPVSEPEPEPESRAEPDDIDLQDDIDAELFPIFEEEADELLPQLQQRLLDWHAQPGSPSAPSACMRTLHTFKGGARLAGAMRLGEMAHRLESDVEALMASDEIVAVQIDPLLMQADSMSVVYERLRRGGRVATAEPATPAVSMPVLPELAPSPSEQLADLASPEPVADLPEPAAAVRDEPAEAAEPMVEAADTGFAEPTETAPPSEPQPELILEPAPEPAAPVVIDWSRFAAAQPAKTVAADDSLAAVPGSGAAVRVRATLLDRLVNNAGEVAITRSRIDGSVSQLQASLGELTESLERMRRQLRDIELQAETQIAARVEAAKSSSEGFDPLEMDRFTRFQELTRFMAESVNDVATLQRSLQRALQTAEDELAAQARLTRELQDDLLRTRMVEFESSADRLYRCVRQAARDTGKQVRLDLVGGSIEIDRGVLERMVGSFEHLLRNSVAHGIEAPAERVARGKEATGQITVTVAQSGNEVAVEFSDDGAGLDLERIRHRGIERGLIDAAATPTEQELAALIFAPGFSTAEAVTELAGRGFGLDVVRAEVAAMGGRVETSTDAGRGTRLRLLLPLTTAVTQVVMLRVGGTTVAVPSQLVELVRRVPTSEVQVAYESGTLTYQDEALPFFWLAALLQVGTRGGGAGRTQSVVIVRSAAQRVAVHVDEVVGNQEVVVKNVGRQLSRLPGLAGVTLLPSGAVALIYNPVALATVYAAAAQAAAQAEAGVDAVVNTVPPIAAAGEPLSAPLVMVVDDSLTVRRVTQRLLVREGYRVVTAKDGLDALERLGEERPAVLLSDIEMPRMDGFDLVRNVRADPRLAGVPVIMITSRIAQKHREHAAELGVDHYLGKPYSEEELLGLIAMHVARAAAAA
jgi:chemosensory pili system protein ChpA (sensor histidine kinase/response regulator)